MVCYLSCLVGSLGKPFLIAREAIKMQSKRSEIGLLVAPYKKSWRLCEICEPL